MSRKLLACETGSSRPRRVWTAVTYPAIIALAVLAALPAGEARAEMIIGTHDVLDAHDGQLYIPLCAQTSGELGEPTSQDPARLVGCRCDTLKLCSGECTSGDVSFILLFELAESLSPNQMIEPDSACVLLELGDLDFKKTVESQHQTWETMTLAFLGIEDDPEDPYLTVLELDESNYGLYRDDGFGPTNNQVVTYTIRLKDDLGVTDEQFAAIAAEGGFGMLVTMENHIMRTATSAWYRNSPERLGNNFQFAQVEVPEPGMVALVAIGGVIFLQRRRR